MADQSRPQLSDVVRRATGRGPEADRAIEILYRQYNPLLRAALPKGLSYDDAEDALSSVWDSALYAFRNGHRVRTPDELVRFLRALLDEVLKPPESAPIDRPRPEVAPDSVRGKVKAFLRRLLP